jgi:peptidoglycan/LPS O-acetylase OafA/YrhL
MQPRRFELIEGLRGVAALSVLAYHGVYKAYLQGSGSPTLQAWASHLDAGVPLFFVISGFLLYRPFVAARMAGRPAPTTEEYGRRRILRIVPAYWVVLLVVGIAGLSYPGSPGILSPEGLPYYFGFLQIYDPQVASGGINVAWSLCVEITFYLMLPFWAALIRRRVAGRGAGGEYVALGLLFAGSVAWQVFALNHAGPEGFGGSAAPWIEPLPNYCDQFAVGMALAVFSVSREGRPVRCPAWLCLAASAVAFWAISTRLGLTGRTDEVQTVGRALAEHQLATLCAAGLLVPAVLGGGGSARRLLGARPLMAAGRWSYGIYLVHVPVLIALLKLGLRPTSNAGLLLFAAVALLITLVAAAALSRFIERPAMRLRRRRENHGAAPAAIMPSST